MTALRARRTAQPAGRLGRGAVERLAVGRRGHGVADGVEQVGPQCERGRPELAHGVGSNRVDEGERVAVGADGGLGLGRPQQVGHGLGAGAGLQQVVADAGG